VEFAVRDVTFILVSTWIEVDHVGKQPLYRGDCLLERQLAQGAALGNHDEKCWIATDRTSILITSTNR
jgi:hypothetical protein